MPAARVIFIMKLYRSNPQDYEDMVSIWLDCGFVDAEDAADAFRSAYPHAPDDPYLANHIKRIAAEGGAG